MSAHLVAQRYARALGATVKDDAQLEDLLHALEDFAGIYAEHADFGRVLESHSISGNSREAALREVVDRSEGSDLVLHFLLTLLRRGRISALPEVVSAFREIVDARLNRAQAEVIVAVTLDPRQHREIESGLEKYSGKDIQMKMRVDPDILGGVVVRMDGTIIDASLRTRLDRIRTALLTEENE